MVSRLPVAFCMWMATPFRELRGGVGCLVVGPTGVGGWRSARGRHCDCGQSRGKTVWYSYGHGVFRGQARVSKRVLAKPQYDEYRRLSKEMFQIMEAYTPTLVPMSIDEGFLDLTSMDRHVWRDTTVPTAADYVNGLRIAFKRSCDCRSRRGGGSTWMAKLATSAAKPGFVEVPPDREQEFLAERYVSELAGWASAANVRWRHWAP